MSPLFKNISLFFLAMADSKTTFSIEVFDLILSKQAPVYETFHKFMSDVSPPMTMDVFLSCIAKHKLSNHSRLYDLFKSYYSMPSTPATDFKTFINAMNDLKFVKGERRYTLVEHKNKINPVPTWDDLFLIFQDEEPNGYEVDTFCQYLDIMKEKPTHEYVIKVMNSIFLNGNKLYMVKQLHKYDLLPTITTTEQCQKYIDAMDQHWTDDTSHVIYEEIDKKKAMEFFNSIKTVPDEKEPDDTLIVSYTVKVENEPDIAFKLDWSNIYPRTFVMAQVQGRIIICHYDGNAYLSS